MSVKLSETLWKVSEDYYFLYVDDKKILRSIKRYYEPKGFKESAVYYSGKGKVIAKQYRVPVDQLRAAKRIARKQLNSEV